MTEDELALRSRIEAERGITHRHGVWWYDAPLPRRLHRCTPWTSAPDVDRCACGAIRGPFAKLLERNSWFERNSRRKKK